METMKSTILLLLSSILILSITTATDIKFAEAPKHLRPVLSRRQSFQQGEPINSKGGGAPISGKPSPPPIPKTKSPKISSEPQHRRNQPGTRPAKPGQPRRSKHRQRDGPESEMEFLGLSDPVVCGGVGAGAGGDGFACKQGYRGCAAASYEGGFEGDALASRGRCIFLKLN